VECSGELHGLGNRAISEPESGVGGKPKHVSSTEKDVIKHIVTRKIIVEFSAIRTLIRD